MSSNARLRKRRLTDAGEGGTQPPEEHTPNPKRQRVSRACDSCRLKKDKCDGAQPVCSTCASLCRPCTYKSNPKKRGLPTGYLRTLELLWGLVFGKIQGSERTVRALMTAENIPAHLASMGKDAEPSDGLVSAWKNSGVFKEIERVLTLLEQGEDGPHKADQGPGDNDSLPDLEGAISGDILEWHIPDGPGLEGENSRSAGWSPANASTAASTAKNPTQDCGTQTLPTEDGMRRSPHPVNGSLQHSVDFTKDNEHRLQLPSNAWPLFDIYFSYTQCWFPILEKHDILRTAFRYSEEDVQVLPSSPGSGEHAALWAVLALSSFQAASTRATRPAADVFNQLEHPDYFYGITKGFIASDTGLHEIGHVQALLIMSLIKFGQRKWEPAWMLVGQAIRIARYLELGCPAAMRSKAAGDVNPGRSKHVFLGCFVLETLISMQISLAPSLRKEDLATVGSVNEDGLEEWHPWEDQTDLHPGQPSRSSFQRGPLRSLSSFNRLVSLVSVLNDLCFLKQNPTGSVSELDLLEHRLQLWVTALPQNSRVDLTTPSKVPSPHIFGLEMAYEGVATCLGLQIAVHESQRGTREVPHQRRASDSARRLLQLVQTYMETYSISATSPIFGMILTFPIEASHESHRDQRGERENITDLVGAAAFAGDSRGTASSHHIAGQHFAQMQNGSSNDDWARRYPVGTTGSPLELEPNLKYELQSLSSQATSIWTVGEAAPTEPTQGADISNMTANRMLSSVHNATPENISGESSRPRLDVPAFADTGAGLNPSSMLPDLSSVPVHPTPTQYPTAYDPNMALDPFVDMDGFGPRRPRIAPDLDALFDELASLDGTER